MSQVQTLCLEAQPTSVVVSPREDTTFSPPQDHHRNQEAPNASIERALGPAPSQPVFEAARVVQVTQTRRASIIVLLVMANVVQMTANFAGIAGGSSLIDAMGAELAYGSWIAASYALTQGTFVLPSGRLGDVYGYRLLVLVGGAWLSVCTLASGFCTNIIAFLTLRALSGLGGAFIMPNAVAMISSTVPPGRARNFSLGVFGASAPIGGYLGALFLGVFLEKTEYKWFFVFLACMGFVVFLPLGILSPSDKPVDQNGKIDYIGSALGTGSLIIFNFVWKYTAFPMMPLDIFKAPSFATLLIVVLFNYMAVGTLIWYQVLWLQTVWHWSTLKFAVGWTPFVFCAVAATCLAAWMIPRMAAQWILAIGTITILISNALMATVPLHQSYWAQIFPSVVLFSFCPDLVYTAGQIIASNSVRRNQQGIAGSIIGTLNLYGNSLGLGFATTIEVQVAQRSGSKIEGYRAALYFGVAISAVALVLDILFVRRVKDDREGWREEDHELTDQVDLTQYGETMGVYRRNAVESNQHSSA
ncbi:hypothetical protein UA08_01729 [Talaromyces atroroseus]|uniref:Major facilitator superfamily (MFS) profile domain-containing protein n=1 Tax=Talaromyces atroroseus TaxID=1441469 RepID=A0A1Q5QAR3_TALAT|nr:hypothetical protein UA08_01729 [Talaromyces atroroseus]OKL62859.1 hypothetical protein UA08_01729 [Talaromyces atroroseus]